MQLVQANPLIWADSISAGWTGWEVLTVYDEWKMVLVMVMFEIEREKMAVVCPSADTADTAAHCESLQRDWIIQKCCADFPPVVKVQLKVSRKASVWKSQAVGHPQLCKKLSVLTLMKPWWLLYFGNHCNRLSCGYLCRLHNWNGDWLSFRYGEHVFISCCCP